MDWFGDSLREKELWVKPLQKSLKVNKSYLQDNIQLLKRIGIKSESQIVLMVLLHHTLLELTKVESTSIRQLITWSKLFVQMASINSDIDKVLKWSCKIAYSQQILNIDNFTEVYSSFFPKILKPIQVNTIIPQWQNLNMETAVSDLNRLYGSIMNVHNIEAMLMSPELYWHRYTTLFMELLKYLLINSNNMESLILTAGIRDMSKKRSKPEMSVDPDKELLQNNSLIRCLIDSGTKISKETIKEGILKLLPYIEHEAKTYSKDNLNKLVILYCSDTNKALRDKEYHGRQVVKALTYSDIRVHELNKQTDGYFSKKLFKLRRLVHEMVSKKQTIDESLISIIDYVIIKTTEGRSDIGMIIFPCTEKIKKQLSHELKVLNKINEKALASLQLDKVSIRMEKNHLLEEFIKASSFDCLVPRSQKIYKAYKSLIKTLNPFMTSLGNTEEYRIGYNEDIEKLIAKCWLQYEESSIKELAEKFRAESAKRVLNEIVIDNIEDEVIRIPIIEKEQDVKYLKSKYLIDLPMILKDTEALHFILEGNVPKDLLRRYAKRRTVVIPQVISNLSSREIWMDTNIILNKIMIKEYSLLLQKKFAEDFELHFEGGSFSKYRLLAEYINRGFRKNMLLREISYKMDYMLKLKSICNSYSNKHPKETMRIAIKALENIKTFIKNTQIQDITKDLLQLLHSFLDFDVKNYDRNGLVKNINDCLKYIMKWKINSPEFDNLLEGVQQHLKVIHADSILTFESILRNYECVLYILAGKFILLIGRPSINIAKQIKLPVSIEFTEYDIQRIYEELIVRSWMHMIRLQDYKLQRVDEYIINLKQSIDNKLRKLKKYKDQYKYREVSQLAALVSLISSLEARSVTANSLLLLIKNEEQSIGELKVNHKTIIQSLLKILMSYLDCNQDILVLYVIGLGILEKAYAKVIKSGCKEDLYRVVKCGEVDYQFITKICTFVNPIDNYSNIVQKLKGEMQAVAYKQFMNLIRIKDIARNGTMKEKIDYLCYLIHQYFLLDNKEDDGVYRYHGMSLSDKITDKYKAIDEMTKSENMKKKAEERQRELEEEFNGYLEMQQILEKSIRKAKELPEKLENKIHEVITNKVKHKVSTLVGTTLKATNLAKEQIPSRECLLQSLSLIQSSLDTLNTTIESIDSSIEVPTESYHFYKDANPVEVKLVHNPVMQLLARIKNLLNEYQGNLILQSTAQICEKLLSFDLWTTTVAQAMTGLELIVNKAHEWQALASKKLNSLDKELSLIYRIIIRYRKLQLISWSALLASKREDYERSPLEIRLASLLIQQILNDHTTDASSIYKTIDQYLINSLMGTFPFRYKVIELLEEHTEGIINNMLKYVKKFYERYKEIYEMRMKELHKPIKDKMNELIKIARWDISNYYAFQNCLNRNHVQLVKILKNYDDILKMPFRTTVFAWSRNENVLSEAHVFQLPKEQDTELILTQDINYNPIWTEINNIIHSQLEVLKENESLASRRRALISLFKQLKEEKVKNIYKQLLAESKIYQRQHFDTDTIHKALNKDSMNLIEKISKYYYKSIDNANVMFGLPAYNERLIAQEIEGMKGFAYNLTYIMNTYATKLITIAREQIELNRIIEQLSNSLSEEVICKESVDGYIKELISLCDNVRMILLQMESTSSVKEYIKMVNELPKDLIAYDFKLLKRLIEDIKELNNTLRIILESISSLYSEAVHTLSRYYWIIHNKVLEFEVFILNYKVAYIPPQSSVEKFIKNVKDNVLKIANTPLTSSLEFEESLLNSLEKLNISNSIKNNLINIITKAPNKENIDNTRSFIKELTINLNKYLVRGVKHLHSYSRAVQLITTIFANILKNGFCIREHSEDNAEENKNLVEELSGMGLGEGTGRQDVSDQLQHEEQIEGLKGEEQERNEGPDKDLDKGFDMEEDFQGDVKDLGEEGKKEAEEKKEGDLQREMEENMGKGEDNKLWNDENELPMEEDKSEGDIQDLRDKKIDSGKDKEQQTKAKEDDKEIGGEEKGEDGKEVDSEGNEEFKEAQRDDEFHLDKNDKMEGLESERELSLSMQSHEENKDKDLQDEDMNDGEINEEKVEGKEELEGKEETQEVDKEVDVKEDIKEEEAAIEELPKGAQSNTFNPDTSMPFDGEEEKAGKADGTNESEALYSQFDIAKVVNEQFEKKQEKKRQSEALKGKLGDNKKEVNRDLTIMEEKDQPVEDRKVTDNDEVMAVEEGKDSKEDPIQAVGETLMELGNDQVAEGKMEGEQEIEIEEMKDEIPIESNNQVTKLTDTKQKNQDKQKAKEVKDKKMEDVGENNVRDEEMKEAQPTTDETKTLIGPNKVLKEEKEEEKKEISYMTSERYEEEKNEALRRYHEWLNSPEKSAIANEMLQKFENLTRSLSATLCEQLRILLEPTQRTKLKGDYKTGKRLNMKKIIPFLASNYRNDKIWMRRSLPNKRDYKILLIIDDSLSMKEHNLGFFALESVVAILQALDILEIGEVCVGAMQENLKILHSFNEKYTRQKAAYILSSFTFDFNKINSADYSLANCVNDANHILELQHFNTKTISIIISDGRFNKSNVKPYLIQATEKGFTYVMIILDNYGSEPSKSILNMKITKGTGKDLQIVPYLQEFPFEFYCVLQDIAHLPFTLSSVLLNWFSQSLTN